MQLSTWPSITDKTLAIIMGGGAGTRLFPLTKERSKPAGPSTELAVRGWVAFCEEVVVCWLANDEQLPGEELLTLLANALPGVVLSVDPQWVRDLS